MTVTVSIVPLRVLDLVYCCQTDQSCPQNLVWPAPRPPPKQAKTRKNVQNQYKVLKIDAFLGGGGNRNLMDKWLVHIWASLKWRNKNAATATVFNPSEYKRKEVWPQFRGKKST